LIALIIAACFFLWRKYRGAIVWSKRRERKTICFSLCDQQSAATRASARLILNSTFLLINKNERRGTRPVIINGSAPSLRFKRKTRAKDRCLIKEGDGLMRFLVYFFHFSSPFSEDDVGGEKKSIKTPLLL